MPRLLLERGIGLNLRVSGRRGKVKAKNSGIGICRAIERFIVRQPPIGEKNDYDFEPQV